MNFKRTNTKLTLLEDYYSHFNEDHRLKTRHGQVEFITSIKYINDYLNNDLNIFRCVFNGSDQIGASVFLLQFSERK